MLKLYVDDVRKCPDGWDLARSYDEAIEKLSTNNYDEVSLDHDIASYNSEGREMTGYDIALWLAERKNAGGHVPWLVGCHSQNPVGIVNISSVVQRYLR
jgi:hypothetical protein